MKIHVVFYDTKQYNNAPTTHRITGNFEMPNNATYLDIRERIKHMVPTATAVITTPTDTFTIPSFLR